MYQVLGLISFPLLNAPGIPFITTDRVPAVFELNRTEILPKPGALTSGNKMFLFAVALKFVNVLSTDP